MCKEKVHWGMQAGIQVDEHQDYAICQQAEHVEQGEDPEEECLHLCAELESHQDEVGDPGLVASHSFMTARVAVTCGRKARAG